MAKFYSSSPEKVKKLTPKKETVNFLLNYSRALNVDLYKEMHFESILN
jgi:hypothetical protein